MFTWIAIHEEIAHRCLVCLFAIPFPAVIICVGIQTFYLASHVGSQLDSARLMSHQVFTNLLSVAHARVMRGEVMLSITGGHSLESSGQNQGCSKSLKPLIPKEKPPWRNR